MTNTQRLILGGALAAIAGLLTFLKDTQGPYASAAASALVILTLFIRSPKDGGVQ